MYLFAENYVMGKRMGGRASIGREREKRKKNVSFRDYSRIWRIYIANFPVFFFGGVVKFR